jgi:murein DD-endopeptidase MepM/ murein hydrolase activator NlpD
MNFVLGGKSLPFLIGIFLILLSGCAGLQPRYHRVQRGDSLIRIASKYDVPVSSLTQKNRRVLASGIAPGQKLYIPFEDNPRWNEGNIESTLENDERSSFPIPSRAEKNLNTPKFTWPVMGAVSSPFGPRRGTQHEGIDIVARKGTPVKASRSGHVIYSNNRISGYGNLIIVKHTDSYATVYAHLSAMKVRKGQFVTRGQVIGLVGATGHATSPHLHFEVRNHRIPQDPLSFLHGQLATR